VATPAFFLFLPPPRAISEVIEPARFKHLGISEKLSLPFEKLERLYPFSGRP
jgi:hypothetical protein